VEDVKAVIRKQPEASPERDMLIARIKELEAARYAQPPQQQPVQQQPQQQQPVQNQQQPQQSTQQQQQQQQKSTLERINQVKDEDLDAALETINTKKQREIAAIYEETLLQVDKTLPYKSPDTVMTVSPIRVSNGEKDLQEQEPSPKIVKRREDNDKSEGHNRPITNLETSD
jgi:hypothetical protein